MKKLLLLIGIMVALFATSCKKDTLVSPVSGDDTPQGDKSECFYFEAVDAGAVVGMVNKKVSLEYSTDKTNWTPFVVDETSVTLANVGNRVYIRAKGTNEGFEDGAYDYTPRSFTATGKVKVGGNIMYLLDGTGENNDYAPLFAFRCLFHDMTSLTDASSLLLPATRLEYYCYSGMFKDCTSLMSAPALPATTLADHCYAFMFCGCTSLTSAPALPATTLEDGCYSYMFENCTSLTAAPSLPATTLEYGCYSNMFIGCTSLTTVPALPATTLKDACYFSMFYNCTSLIVNIEGPGKEWIIPATEMQAQALDEMFSGTGGAMNGTPELNTTYYIASDPNY